MIVRENEEGAGGDRGAIREGEVDTAREGESAQVEEGGAGVLQLDEFKVIPVRATDVGRMIHDFRDAEAGEVLRGKVDRLAQRAPVGAGQDAGVHPSGTVDQDRVGAGLGRASRPFDRMLVAQSLTGGMSIVSVDAVFDRYSVPRIW